MSKSALTTLKLYNGTSEQLLTEGEQNIVSNITVSKFHNENPFYCAAESEGVSVQMNCSMHFTVVCEYDKLAHTIHAFAR